MECALLYSGGKDSTLAALFLERFYDVTLVTGTFGVTDDHQYAREAARAAGFDHATVDLDRSVAAEAVERMVADGYPREGIQAVHEHAVERVAAGEWCDRGIAAVADGTRRDDRVPAVERPFAQSIEDRFGVDYLAPLAGIGRGAIDAIASEHLDVTTGPSATVRKGDYESELRALLADEYGEDAVAEIFPEHTQSRVTGRR